MANLVPPGIPRSAIEGTHGPPGDRGHPGMAVLATVRPPGYRHRFVHPPGGAGGYAPGFATSIWWFAVTSQPAVTGVSREPSGRCER